MCIFWICKYTLCGCIWDKGLSKCPDSRLCWGPRMVYLQSNTATCRECWMRGDKRIAEETRPANDDEDGDWSSNTPTIDCEGDPVLYYEEEYFSTEESPVPSPPSRPMTPQLYYEIHPAWCPVAEDNDFEMTRVCEPVDLGSVWADYRARRHKSIPVQCLLGDEPDEAISSSSSDENLDDQTPEEVEVVSDDEEDELYYSMVAPHARPKSPTKILEDQSLRFYGLRQEYYPSEE
ncbi:hypothetical protein N7535_005310 [Penicillium sp. DV-2018c]|nr:hypothetical protein N7461_008891 [Penicillium sp. DV-2018c]KAJ5571650.1 hypothetical protein N7535_005310 [Penicillium sp. DV-2018c]